jgi:hypothetical protein
MGGGEHDVHRGGRESLGEMGRKRLPLSMRKERRDKVCLTPCATDRGERGEFQETRKRRTGVKPEAKGGSLNDK